MEGEGREAAGGPWSPQTPGNEAEMLRKNRVYLPSQTAARVWGGKGGLRLFPPVLFLQVGGQNGASAPFPQQKSPSSPKKPRRAVAWGPLPSVCPSVWAFLTVLGSIALLYLRFLPTHWRVAGQGDVRSVSAGRAWRSLRRFVATAFAP